MILCILVEGRIKEKYKCAYIRHVGQVSDTVQVSDSAQITRQVSLLGIHSVKTRQEISNHISIAYKPYFVLDYAHICSINCLSFTTPGYNLVISCLYLLQHTWQDITVTYMIPCSVWTTCIYYTIIYEYDNESCPPLDQPVKCVDS